MAKAILLVTTLLLAALLAGCSGGDGKSDVNSASTSTQTNVGDTTVSGSISVGPDGGAINGSVNGTQGNGSAAATWTYDNRTGTISGNGAIVNVPFEEEESFQVAENTSRMFLNLTATGHELTLSLRAPDCAASECAQEVTTQSGSASLEVTKPGEGEWVAVLQLEGTGPVEADYALAIAQLGPGSAA
jgi:hypothetical protein